MDPSGVNGFKKNESYGATAAINFTQVTTVESYSVRDSQNVFSHVLPLCFLNFLFLFFSNYVFRGIVFNRSDFFCLFQS